MANVKEPTPGTMGWRINRIRDAIGVDREGLAAKLAEVAGERGLGGAKWTPSRVSRVILSRKPVTLDEVSAVVLLARKEGLGEQYDWDWLVFGDQAVQRGAKPSPKETAAPSTRHQTAKRGAK